MDVPINYILFKPPNSKYNIPQPIFNQIFHLQKRLLDVVLLDWGLSPPDGLNRRIFKWNIDD